MTPTLRELCDANHAWYPGDNSFQRQARLRQAMWRAEQGLPIGTRTSNDETITWGSRLEMPAAKDALLNYLTPTIRERVEQEISAQKGVAKAHQKLFGSPRIYDDLLSSQPLCFNLFAELDADLDLATLALGSIWPDRISDVERIEFEHSPGRQDPKYLNNGSAFDVFVRYRTPAGTPGFIGIEVKYHENMQVNAAEKKDRYDEVAQGSHAFKEPGNPKLRKPPLQQIWLDHLLALSMLQSDDGWDEGFFALLAPASNAASGAVAAAYQPKLAPTDSTFDTVTLECVVDAIEAQTNADWIRELRSRYLDLSAIPES